MSNTSPKPAAERAPAHLPQAFGSKAHDDGTADLSGCVLCGRSTPNPEHFVEIALGGHIVRADCAEAGT